MFTYETKMEVNSHEVIDVVRLLGSLGLRFEISNEYSRGDALEPNRKVCFRRFVVYGTRKELKAFFAARKLIQNYHLH
jgi:hypothetical protein